jgi:hypothetical protein
VISDTHTNRDAHAFISVPLFDDPASPPWRQPKQSGEEKEPLPFIRLMRQIGRAFAGSGPAEGRCSLRHRSSLFEYIFLLSTFPRVELLSSGDRLLWYVEWYKTEQYFSRICPHVPQREQQPPRERASVAIQTASFAHMLPSIEESKRFPFFFSPTQKTNTSLTSLAH